MRYALPDRYTAALSVAYGGGLAVALVVAACSPPFPAEAPDTPPGSAPTATAPTPPQVQP